MVGLRVQAAAQNRLLFAVYTVYFQSACLKTPVKLWYALGVVRMEQLSCAALSSHDVANVSVLRMPDQRLTKPLVCRDRTVPLSILYATYET